MKKDYKDALIISASTVLGNQAAHAATNNIIEVVSAEAGEEQPDEIVINDVQVVEFESENTNEPVTEVVETDISTIITEVDIVEDVYGPLPYIYDDDDVSNEIDDTMCVYGPPPETF